MKGFCVDAQNLGPKSELRNFFQNCIIRDLALNYIIMLRPESTYDSVLISTLGGQPRVVTFALDWLLRRGYSISEVVVLYISLPGGRVEAGLRKLHQAFARNQYRGQPCRFRQRPVRQEDRVLGQIRNEAEAGLVRQTVHQLVMEYKQAGYTLHFCIAGGPRMIALMTLSVVMMHCGHQDRVWHMVTEPDFVEALPYGEIYHDPSGEQVQLVQVPVVPWGEYFPALHTLYQRSTDLYQAQTQWLDANERQRCQQVAEALSERQGEVLREFAAGLSPQQVAAKLSITIKTLDSHKTVILGKCRNAWALADDDWLDYHFLREKFAPYFRLVD